MTSRNTSIEDAQKNLEQFPRLKKFIGDDWEKMTRSSPLHPLVRWLALSAMPESAHDEKPKGICAEGLHDLALEIRRRLERLPYARIVDLEASLSLLEENMPEMHMIRHGLLDKNQFFNIRTELAVAARLKKQYTVTLQPPVPGRVLDIESIIEGSKVLFEVYRPQEDDKLNSTGPVYIEKGKVPKKIVKKIREQIKYARHSGLPVVLVIDSSKAMEITSHIINYLFLGSVSPASYKNGEVSPSDLEKTENSIYYKRPKARVISAILLLNIYPDICDMKIKFNGEFFKAPFPLIPLDDSTVDAIKAAVLHTGM